MKVNTAPLTHAAVIVPADGTDLNTNSRGLYVGVTGNVKVTTVDGDTVLFKSLAAGIVHPIACKRVWDATTTATDMLAVW